MVNETWVIWSHLLLIVCLEDRKFEATVPLRQWANASLNPKSRLAALNLRQATVVCSAQECRHLASRELSAIIRIYWHWQDLGSSSTAARKQMRISLAHGALSISGLVLTGNKNSASLKKHWHKLKPCSIHL